MRICLVMCNLASPSTRSHTLSSSASFMQDELTCSSSRTLIIWCRAVHSFCDGLMHVTVVTPLVTTGMCWSSRCPGSHTDLFGAFTGMCWSSWCPGSQMDRKGMKLVARGCTARAYQQATRPWQTSWPAPTKTSPSSSLSELFDRNSTSVSVW